MNSVSQRIAAIPDVCHSETLPYILPTCLLRLLPFFCNLEKLHFLLPIRTAEFSAFQSSACSIVPIAPPALHTLLTLVRLRYGSPGRPAAGITCKPRDACGYMVCATNCNLLCNLQFEETELRIATMGYHPEIRSVKVIHYFISTIPSLLFLIFHPYRI